MCAGSRIIRLVLAVIISLAFLQAGLAKNSPNQSISDQNLSENDESGHGKMDHAKMVMDTGQEDSLPSQKVRVEEHLGGYAALDTYFKDETGRSVKLETLFDKPVVLLPIYFMCPSICDFLQADLARALNFVDQVPGRDFNIISLSFSDTENDTHAYESKQNYNNLITRDFPLDNWFYLTGDKENIKKLTDSLGYYFIKTKPNFYIHPSVLMVLAGDGKIIRYLYGPNFLPFDLGMAISEAEKGQPGISIKRGVLAFCFDYDPENKTYVFKLFRITGTAILIVLLGFIVFLLYPSKRDRIKKNKTVS